MIVVLVDALVNALPRLSSTVHTQKKYLRAARSSCCNHSFAQSKSHLPWLQIRHHNDQSPNELFRLVGCFDSSNTCRVSSPPRLNCNLSSLFASGTCSAEITRATRRSIFAKSFNTNFIGERLILKGLIAVLGKSLFQIGCLRLYLCFLQSFFLNPRFVRDRAFG